MRSSAVSGRLIGVLIVGLAACSTQPVASGDTGFGAQPELPAPQSLLLPTIHIAPAKARDASTKPTSPVGFAVTAFAQGLDPPRWLYTLPNGDVLVAEQRTGAA